MGSSTASPHMIVWYSSCADLYVLVHMNVVADMNKLYLPLQAIVSLETKPWGRGCISSAVI